MRSALYMMHQSGHDTAIIAGGAIRDMFHDVTISDVDIFVQYKNKNVPRAPFGHPSWIEHWTKVFQLQDKLFSTVQSVYSPYSDPEGPNGGGRQVMAVWDIFSEGIEYQVIMLNVDPIKYVDQQFDFGICRAYFDGSRVRYSREFVRDSRNKTITLVCDNLSPAQVQYATTHHLAKIQAKYPGYRLEIPENIAEIYQLASD
jgi:hypothetical protein